MPQLEHIEAIEKRLWSAADNLRANSNYASNEYFLPVMGLIFLRHAYSRYLAVKDGNEANLPRRGGKTRPPTKEDFSQEGAIYLRPEAQFDTPVALPDSANRARAIQHAMDTIEEDYEGLKGVLPRSEYAELDNEVLGQLLRTLNPEELKQASGDIFGRIYEYFLTQFADLKAHDGGEFFTPVSLVQMIANVIEPDHEHVRVVDGVPKGWDRVLFAEVCDSIGGGTPSTAVTEYWDGEITWVTPSDVTKSSSLYLLDSEKKITEAGLRNSSAKMLPAEAILMTSRASIGFFAVANRPVCTNQGFIAVVPKVEHSRSFLLFHLMSRVEEFRSRASGSTFKELSKGKFRELSVIWPDRSICREFEDNTAPIFAQIQSLAITNAKLVQARDLLLPRLMCGEIEV